MPFNRSREKHKRRCAISQKRCVQQRWRQSGATVRRAKKTGDGRSPVRTVQPMSRRFHCTAHSLGRLRHYPQPDRHRSPRGRGLGGGPDRSILPGRIERFMENAAPADRCAPCWRRFLHGCLRWEWIPGGGASARWIQASAGVPARPCQHGPIAGQRFSAMAADVRRPAAGRAAAPCSAHRRGPAPGRCAPRAPPRARRPAPMPTACR